MSNTSPLTNLAVIGRLDLVRIQLTAVAVPTAPRLHRLIGPVAGIVGILSRERAGEVVVRRPVPLILDIPESGTDD